MDKLDIDTAFDKYRDILMNGFIPDSMQMALGDVRKLVSEDSSSEFLAFLETVVDVPERALVWLQKGQVPHIMISETGHYVAFA